MLKQIKNIIKRDLGLRDVSTVDVNQAALDLFSNYELEDREREVTLALPCDQLIVIPSEIDRILKFRRNDTGLISGFNDQSWKYKTGNWEKVTIDYELLSQGPLKRSILNAGPVYITTKRAETIPVNVIITGSNDDSAQITNDNLYSAGTTQQLSTRAFKNIFAITKSEVTTYDFVFTDIDGRELSRIPSNKLSASYKIVRLFSLVVGLQAGYVDCLFVPPYRPLVNENDEFQCGSRYDQAIAYQFYYNIYSGQGNVESVQLADQYLMLIGSEIVKKSKNANKSVSASKPIIGQIQLMTNPLPGYMMGYSRGYDYPMNGSNGYYGY